MGPVTAREVSREFFSGLWIQYPEGSVRTVGWRSRESQGERFRILAGLDHMKRKSVLDVGCGFGDFYGYLVTTGEKPKGYLGIDRNARTLHEGAVRYPDADFLEADFLDVENLEKFDYVVASGIFHLKAEDWWENMVKTILKMYALCEIGVAFNFLSPNHKPKAEGPMYVSPVHVLNSIWFAVDTKKFHLIHGYRSNDFTVYLYR